MKNIHFKKPFKKKKHSNVFGPIDKHDVEFWTIKAHKQLLII